LRSLKVALLASYTIDPLVPFLKVESARVGFGLDVSVAPFNTARQALLDPHAGGVAQADVVVLAELLSDVCPALAIDYLDLGAEDITRAIDETVDALVAALSAFRFVSTARVVVHNYSLPESPMLGLYEVMATRSQTEAIRRLNRTLADAVSAIADVYVLDFERICADIGYRRSRDEKMWALARAPLSAAALAAVGERQARLIRALYTPARKCLVLDLDNTLWGGVLGEAGMAGIKLGQTYPGNAYRQFQQFLLQLNRRGVLLAINSKNNPEDAAEVLASHPDMVLRSEHFAAMRVNWTDKPSNMLAIAEELNIGLDSLVFLDDNPAECALMRDALPQVLTLHAPQDPTLASRVVIHSGAFDRLSLTEEDLGRSAMYREQRARATLASTARSLDDFLADLQMTATIKAVDDFTFPRAYELITKTNQFNLTTRRYTPAELKALTTDPKHGVFTLQLTDRFGDNGIVGLAVAGLRERACDVDAFLLSCRVIGRTAETALLAFLVDWARTRGADAIEGDFIPTKKNAPAADFYARHGFVQSHAASTHTRWRLVINQAPFTWPPHIRLAELQEAS
jgi:FkbH-like protein